MIKKCRFLAGCLTLSMIFASAVPAVFAEDAAVSEDETTVVEAVDEISDEAVVDEAVVDESEEVDVLSEDDADVSVAAVDYSAWVKGDANANDNSPGAITPNVEYNGKDALYIENRNAYTVFPEPVTEGKVTFSLDLYLEKGARNFRVYFENAESTYTNKDNVFAEVINNDKEGAVYFGPTTEAHTDNAHKLFDITSDGWYHFDLALDYGELQDGSVSDKFITINATDANGNPMCEEMTIGAISGKDVSLKSIRIVKTVSGLYAANMTIEQGGDMIFAESSNFADAELGDSNIPSNWTISAGGNNKGEIVNDDEKGHVLMLQKNYDDDEQTTSKSAVFARYKLNKTYSGNTEIEADIKLTYGGRIGMFAASQSSETSTSTLSPRLFAWSDNDFPSICNHYEAYNPTSASSSNRNKNNAVPPMNTWTTWKFVINGNALTYDVYIDGNLMFEGLNAQSDMFNGNVGQVGFQIQSAEGTLGTILVSEVRVYNDSIVDPEKEKAKINAALDGITLPTETAGEDIILPTQAAGHDIVWTSSNPDVIANIGGIGRVVRKDSVIGDVEVVLTATVTYEDMIITREFTVKSIDNRDTDSLVKSQILTDLMDLGLTNGETLYSDIELPTVGRTYGTKISWITSNASVISAKGNVKRPNVIGAKTVTLTAVGELEGTNGPVKETYAYTFKVVGRGSSSVSSGGGGGGFVAYSPGTPTSNTTSTAAPSGNTTDENGNGTQGTSSVGFTDLDNVGWAQEAIDYMFSKGYVNGVGDGKFAPNDAVTREQFVKMLVNVFGLEAASDSAASFSDVQPGAWYAEYVNIAASLGIVSGMGDGSFGVGTPISRQDMAVMIARCTNVEGGDAAEFADDSAISDYAADAVHAMKSAGYISGDEKGNFNPKNTATRAETATVLYRISAGK